MTTLTRRQILAGAAATAAVAAMPAVAIAAVERAPFDVDRFVDICVAETERLHPGINGPFPGWAHVINDVTRTLLAQLPVDLASEAGGDLGFELTLETMRVSNLPGPHRWVAVNTAPGSATMRIVGPETWSYRQALIDAGHELEALS